MEPNDEEGISKEKNSVLVGKKPTMNYVLAAVTQFNSGANSIRIKARGNSISKAVDVAEIVKNRFIPDLKKASGKDIEFSTEEVTNEDGTKSKVSSIRLLLKVDDSPAVDSSENIIYICKKPTMNYVLAVVTQFNSGAKNIVVKARGNSISKAVDVAEITRNKFIPNLSNPSCPEIQVNSEELTNEDGTKSKVSSIAILLSK